ncbi:MAG: peptidase T [Bacteroidota bacterium]|nr:peptidase T [Bacteroidota bacterium]
MSNLLNRFLKYIKFDTQSDDNSETFPSTSKQLVLAVHLKEELTEFGLKDVHIDEKGYLMATLPSNLDYKAPVIGFLAHYDTSPDMSGANVNPQIIQNYDGKEIVLNKDKNLILSPVDFPELSEYVNQTIITTDGNTLLGADDKAGIAEIITAVEYLINHPEIKHPEIKIGFTPDEEIGRGVDFFDVNRFGADIAYTMDGGGVGELECENFNAASAKIYLQGKNIHPGYAKNKMINSMLVGIELNEMLPVNERPEFTENYEGFYHIIKFEGSVEKSMLQYIIRDHDRVKFEHKKEFIQEAVSFINKKYGEGVATIEIKDQYYNMKEKIVPVYYIVENAIKAMNMADVKPIVVPIRGGTDGARLSFMGLPCPNIFAGGINFHGKYEYVSLQSMEKAVEVIINLAKIYSEK